MFWYSNTGQRVVMDSILDAWPGFNTPLPPPFWFPSIPHYHIATLKTSQATNKNVRNIMKSEAYQSGKIPINRVQYCSIWKNKDERGLLECSLTFTMLVMFVQSWRKYVFHQDFSNLLKPRKNLDTVIKRHAVELEFQLHGKFRTFVYVCVLCYSFWLVIFGTLQ